MHYYKFLWCSFYIINELYISSKFDKTNLITLTQLNARSNFMLKLPYIIAVSVALMATAHTAHAQDKYYAKLGANFSSSASFKDPDSNIKINATSGIMPEVAFGFNLDDGLAVELSYQKMGVY